MNSIILELKENKFTLQWNTGTAQKRESKEYKEEHGKIFKEWIENYRTALQQHNPADRKEILLNTGRDIYAWLDSFYTGWLKELLHNSNNNYIIEYTVNTRPGETELLFLEVPWELLADSDKHLALDEYTKYIPVRRIGKKQEPAPPDNYRLSMVFMASAPEGADQLNYEKEETAIIKALKGNIDLTVEESGTINELSKSVTEEEPHILHISCHGNNEPAPVLLFESDEGTSHEIQADLLSQEISGHKPRLIFLSACKTSAPDTFINTYSTSMVRHGFESVLGWGGSVSDEEATIFASGIYHFLAAKNSIEQAIALARYRLINKMYEKNKQSGDWHLARIYLSGKGGGILTNSINKKHNKGINSGVKEFLDAKTQEVPVANRHEFTGRRRPIQKILREIRKPAQTHAGIIIHGIGSQGKSSLAARIANRLYNYTPIVIYKNYSAYDILKKIKTTVPGTKVTEIITKYENSINDNPGILLTALNELLNQCFKSVNKNESGECVCSPILLIIDDFERILDEPTTGNGLHTIKPSIRETIKSVINAFNLRNTDSRLIITSRYKFQLMEDDTDIAAKLFDLHLPPMNNNERKKLIIRKLEEKQEIPANITDIEQCAETGMGNPGLQNLITGIYINNPEEFKKISAEITDYISGNKNPGEQELINFLQHIALDKIMHLLIKEEKDLIKACSIFNIPVPADIMIKLADITGVKHTAKIQERMTGFGIWDTYNDIVNPGNKAYMLNKLVHAKTGKLTKKEEVFFAEQLVRPLYETWKNQVNEGLPGIICKELTALAVKAQDAEVLQDTAGIALFWFNKQFKYIEGADLGREAIKIMDKNNTPVNINTLRIASELNDRTGEAAIAKKYIIRAVKDLDNKKNLTYEEAAAFLHLGRMLADEGEPEEALKILNKCSEQYKSLGDKRSEAVTMGDIARILTSQGQVEQALKMHYEILETYKSLGDKRSEAVTMGDIARILTSQGQVEQALKMHYEMIEMFKSLGDKKGEAVTMGDIARILKSQGQVEQALKMHYEILETYKSLGDKKGEAVAMGDIARILTSQGQVEQALKMHYEEIEIYKSLGDISSMAAALYDIGNIELDKNMIQEAFTHLSESYDIFMKLGQLDGISMVGIPLGQILAAYGHKEEGLAVLQASLEGFKKLGWPNYVEQVEEIINEIDS